MPFAIVAAVVAVVGAAAGAYSAAAQADAQKKSLDYQAQVAANNAKIAAWQRSDQLQQGEVEAHAAMQKQGALLSAQRASLAANGVDATDSGSALDLLASTKFLGAQDVNTIQSNAARKAWGYDVVGSNDNASSTLDSWKASMINPAASGAIAGTTSLLGSATSFYGAKSKG